MSGLSYIERLKALNLTTLTFRRIRGDMIEVWKHFNSYSTDILPANFRRVDRTIRGTRHPLQLYPNIAKDGVQGPQNNSFYYRVAKRWNKLPSDVVTAQSMNAFKNRFDKYIENNEADLRYLIVSDDE